MDKKIKIAIVVYTLKFGGLERMVSNQTLLFYSLGYEVELFVLENEIDYPYKGKLHVYDLNSNDNFFTKIKKYLKLKKDIRNGNFDFILDHRYRINNFMELFWTKFIYKNQLLVYFIHSSDLKKYVNSNFIQNKNIEFISVSKGIEHLTKSNYPNIKIQTIYNYIENSKIEKQFDELEDSFILAVGRMDVSNVKQFDVLIDCYSKSILPEQKIKLLILGSGPRMNFLKEQVKNLNLEQLIVFKGFESDLYPYYKNAKFLVLSSKYEGLGMVLIECLLCETPVISYDCEFGPNEIIQNKVNGLLVENQNSEKLTEAMSLFVQNKNLYDNCKRNTFESVLKFSKKNIAQEWIQFFNDRC